MRRAMRAFLTICVAALWTSGAWAADPPRWAGLKTPCVGFALDPRTGAVLGLDVNANTATLYPRAYLDGKNTDVVGPVKTGTAPIAAVFKAWKDKTYFVVASHGEARIDVLDAATLKSVAQIAVKDADVSSLTTSRRADDPYVYYAFGRGHGSTMGRVSVEDFRDAAVTLSGPYEQVMDMEVSADGTVMYTRGPWSPSGFQAFRAVRDEGGEVRWVQIFREHTSVAPYLPDPFGIYAATGSVIYTADLKRNVKELDEPVMAFFPDRPVIVTAGSPESSGSSRYRRTRTTAPQETTGPRVTALSYNDFRVLGRATLPGERPNKGELAFPESKEGGQGDFKRLGYRTQFFADPGANRVLVCTGGNVGLVPVSALSVPDEPLLVAQVNAPGLLRVGQAAEIAVTPIDRRAAISLKDPPAGMNLTGGKISWTPSNSQVGRTSVLLQLKHGDVVREQAVDLDVVQPCVRLGFIPNGIEISPDGKRAVAWSTAGRDDPWNREKKPNSRMALIDVEAQKVLVEKELLYGITTAAVDAQFIYVAPSDSDRVNALDHKELVRQKHVLTEGRAQDIIVLSPKLLAVRTEKGIATFALPDLTLSKTGATSVQAGGDDMRDPYALRRRMRMEEGDGGAEIVRLSDGWSINGALFSADMTRTRMLLTAEGLPGLDVQRQNQARQRLPWHRLLRQTTLMSVSGPQIADLGGGEPRILPDVPAAAVLSVSGWDGEKVSGRLAIRDLVSGEPVWQTTLFEEPREEMDEKRRFALERLNGDRGMGWGRSEGQSLAVAGRTLVALLADRLFVVTLTDAVTAKCTTPLEFKPFDAVTVIDGTKANAIPLALRGGQAPFEFELATSHDALGVEVKTGVVTVDGPKALQAATDLLKTVLLQEERGYREDVGAMTPKQRITALAQQSKDRYKQLTGLDAGGIPVLLPVGVVVSDRNQQMSSIDCQFVVVVPEAALIKVQDEAETKIKAEEEARRKESERQQKEYERRMAERDAKARVPDADTTAPVDERIRALEDRIRTLEIKIDTLIRLLGDRANPPKDAKNAPKVAPDDEK